jgi:hypothetical protein
VRRKTKVDSWIPPQGAPLPFGGDGRYDNFTIAAVSEKTSKLAELCRRFGVERLELFGSAATGAFDAASSDLDFIERGIHCTFKPVLDEGPGYRSRETMEDHRR